MIKLSIHSTGSGKCALTNKDEADGLTVAFEGEQPVFLSKKGFWQILAMRAAQAKLAAPTKPATPTALPANGSVPVAAK